jgi:hypothetical protein
LAELQPPSVWQERDEVRPHGYHPAHCQGHPVV